MRHPTALLPLILLTAIPAQAQMVTITPEQVGQIFCISSLGNDITPAYSMLSEGLESEIARASERNLQFEIDNPGEKTPLGDGLPWRTSPDYADGCEVGEVTVKDFVARVPIHYSFSDYPAGNYTDHLILLPAYYEVEGDPLIWRIDDIELSNGLNMRFIIGTAFEP
ncbi:hypothetical protein [Devosia sediminis]|uniref:Uncharacterized protein n=1 Tax=Devosia sediminis TaxID=2798801 RepID=A0A934IVG4_9HYPH|nr:hypothetical protein [Devosia sediminis]MBJ3783523.1 hypothetical protein [Devosia sediminis]